jgi:flagellar FliJ protein
MLHVLPQLIEQATQGRDREAARLQQAQRTVQQARSTLERLQAFRLECLARSPAASHGRGDGATLADYQRFVSRLDEAIVMQGHELAQREQQAAQQQQRLVAAQQRLLAFDTLKRRQLQQRHAREQRREQRAADEFAARAFVRAEDRQP